MDRLQQELHRLYLLPAVEGDPSAVPAAIDEQGHVRALVLELARPADWATLSATWHGVQADWDWPAPAIAVSGRDGYQLWFSLSQSVPAVQASSMLVALQQRFLASVRPERLTLWPMADVAASPPWRHAPPVPALQAGTDHWSAFVAADLAPLFIDEPWLDTSPGVGGQADLLAQLHSIPTEGVLRLMEHVATLTPGRAAKSPAAETALPDPAVQAQQQMIHANMRLGPKQFLLAVMHDSSAALALRIEAATALLPYVEDKRQV